MSGGSTAPMDAAAQASLRRHYLFSALTDTQWQNLRPRVHLLRLAAAQRLFAQGEPATAFFVVRSGSVKLFRESLSGLEKIMRLLKSNQSFAESVLFCEPPCYPVHAQAVTDTVLLRIEREPYLALLRESFDTSRAVMAQMVQRIHDHWDEIEALSLHGSQARVARYLLDLLPAAAAAPTVRLPAHKVLIAGQLGLAPETLSRGLRSLVERGVIAVHGQVVQILDPQALSQSAQL
jgi:CRP-like cAMP-binding protein